MNNYINDTKVNAVMKLKSSDGFCFCYEPNPENGSGMQKLYKLKEGLYFFVADTMSKGDILEITENIFDHDLIGIYHYISGGVLLQINNYIGKLSSGDTFYFIGNPEYVIAKPISEKHSSIGFICYAENLDLIIDEYKYCEDIDVNYFYNSLSNIQKPFIMKTKFNLTMIINELLTYTDKNNYYMIKNKALELLYKSISQYENFFENKITYKVDVIEIVHQIKEYMALNYKEKIVISELVKKYGINKTYFYEVFTYLYEISPYKYIIKLRLSETYNLLMETELSVEEVSNICGYDNTNKFINIFKNEYGKTPGKIRL